MDITKHQLKHIKSLHQTKFRQIYKNFIGEGHKLCIELLNQSKFELESVLFTPEWADNHPHLISRYKDISYIISNEQMAQISALKTPTEVLIVAKQSLNSLDGLTINTGNYFFLDSIQDPGNVGTIIRLADWFGFSGVIASPETADFFNPKVVQATMGSIAGPMLIESSAHLLENFKGIYDFYAMDMEGKNLDLVKFGDKNIFILGNEGKGISLESKSLLKYENYLSIPGNKTKIAESLNVGIAAGILANHISNRTTFIK
jgi:RNA methyltransferase, TrmH family